MANIQKTFTVKDIDSDKNFQILFENESLIKTELDTVNTSINEIKLTTKSVSSSTYNVINSDMVVLMNSSSTRTVNLPVGTRDLQFVIKDGAGNASGANITITPFGSQTIDGSATLVISTDYGYARLIFNGSEWNQI